MILVNTLRATSSCRSVACCSLDKIAGKQYTELVVLILWWLLSPADKRICQCGGLFDVIAFFTRLHMYHRHDYALLNTRSLHRLGSHGRVVNVCIEGTVISQSWPILITILYIRSTLMKCEGTPTNMSR